MFGSLRRHRTGVALSALLTVGMALTACSSGGTSFSGGTSSGSGDSSGAAGAGISLKATEFPWSAAKLTNVILTEVATQHPELGVSGIEATTLGPAPAWAGAQRGDVDLLSEVALPNQQELADKAKANVSLVHQTYGDAQQGWFVPTYATEPGQPLAGLTSVTQLNDYAAPLGNKLVDADPSFITTQQNAKRLQGYGLTLEQVASSEAAQLAELRRAYQAKEPILVYLYHPHWVFAEFEMTQLQEPNPYTPDCFTTGNGACAMPAYAAWTAASTKVQQDAPKFYAMLQKFEIPVPDMEGMLKSVDVDKKDATAVAKEWLGANQAKVDQWLATA
jgi:glycine betaine/proline transport system substrate-binding protein